MKNASLPIATIEFDPASDEIAPSAWSKSALAAITDRQLIEAVAEIIAIPKASKSSSFILHAPLELSARALLLPFVSQNARDDARRQIASFARRYLNLGDNSERAAVAFESDEAALVALQAAITSRDVDAADHAIQYLETRIDRHALLRQLSDFVSPSLAAAAHAPILMSQLSRLSAVVENPSLLLRAPIRFLARHADLQIQWIDRFSLTQTATDEAAVLLALEHALCNLPRSQAASTSIAPMVEAVDNDPAFDKHRQAIADAAPKATLRSVTQRLYRVAAHSMLQDVQREAPYGWTHCLTIPQGILGCVPFARDPQRALACAATHTLATRAKLSEVPIDLDWKPNETSKTIDEVQNASPPDAAAIAYWQTSRNSHAIKTRLADYAATHRDAHLVKYTLACFDAANDFPEDSALFLASAAYLGAWWRMRDKTTASIATN
jgi:hypothetical protein